MTISSQSLDKDQNLPPVTENSRHGAQEKTLLNEDEDDYEDGQLITAEDRKFGSVSNQVYMTYAKSFGILSVTLIITALLGIQASNISADLWLALWSSDDEYEDYSNLEYVLIYIALGIAQGISTFLTAFWIYRAGLKTSLRLHNEMLESILRSPMAFFDTTPIGRILNRFSKDQNIIDDTLPNVIEYYVEASFDLVTAILVLGITIPYMIFVILPMVLLYSYLRGYYVSTSRELQRLESISRSPVLSFLAETVNGLSIINAFGYGERFLVQNEQKLDLNHAVYHPKTCSQRWLSVRLEFIGNIIVTTTFLFVVLRRDGISPGLAGFALKYALSVTECLDWVVQMSCETETNLVAVERIKEFTQLESEGPAQVIEQKPANSWPSKGSIEFRNVSLRYREGLDLVLKQVSFEINPGEKIGICGRTGAGKSTLTLGIFRIMEPVDGCIRIDGIDIQLIGLDDLRSRIAIIPQEPFLFRGTIRLNIDPFGIHTEDELWAALKTSHLHAYVSSLPEKLDNPVLENGDNLSTGQRQLICLARALLRRTKILVLDEATAAVDHDTDRLIQETIKTAFQECTVLTIAHRMNTIVDCDRVMVYEKGVLMEFDSPAALLKQPDSIFASLVGNSHS